MNRRFGLTLPVFAMLVIGQVEARGQETFDKETINIETTKPLWGNGARAIEGTWQTQVTIRLCPNGDVTETFSKLVSFHQGGTANETSSSSLFRTTAFGLWQHNNGDSFRYVLRFFRFNPDGTHAGSVRALWNVTLDDFSDSYTATSLVEILAPNGTVVATRCGSETGTRVVFPN